MKTLFILALVAFAAAAPVYDLDEEDDINLEVEDNPYDEVSYKEFLKIAKASQSALVGTFNFPGAAVQFDLEFVPGKGGKFALADKNGKNLMTEEYEPTKTPNFYNVLRTVLHHKWLNYQKQDDSLIMNNIETNEEVKAPGSIHDMQNQFYASKAMSALPALSHALGKAGHAGTDSPVAMWLHKLAMGVGEVNEEAGAFHPDDKMRDGDDDDLSNDIEASAQGWWRKKSCSKSHCGTIPTAKGEQDCKCCGKCGKKCGCWWLVCRNCKWNKGCFVHDYCECAHGYGGKCFWGAFDAFLHCGGCKKCSMGCPGGSPPPPSSGGRGRRRRTRGRTRRSGNSKTGGRGGGGRRRSGNGCGRRRLFNWLADTGPRGKNCH